MNESQLRAIVDRNESDRLELTTSESKTDKFAKAVCAFANDLPNSKQPGYLMIGVKDDGQIVGARVNDELLRTRRPAG